MKDNTLGKLNKLSKTGLTIQSVTFLMIILSMLLKRQVSSILHGLFLIGMSITLFGSFYSLKNADNASSTDLRKLTSKVLFFLLLFVIFLLSIYIRNI